MKRFVLVVLSLVLLSSLLSCNILPNQAGAAGTVITDFSSYDFRVVVLRIVDKDAGVTCWVYVPHSISCLPLDSTNLP